MASSFPALDVKTPQVEYNPMGTLQALAQMRGMQTENLLRQQQMATSAAQMQDLQEQAAQRKRENQAQMTYANAMKDPDIAQKVAGGDLTPLYNLGLPSSLIDAVNQNVTQNIKNRAEIKKDELAQQATAANEIGGTIAAIKSKSTDEDGTFHADKAQALVQAAIPELANQGHFQTLKVDPSALQNIKINNADDLDNFSTNIGALKAQISAAAALKKTQAETAEATGKATQAQAEAENFNAQAANTRAKLPAEQADAQIAQSRAKYVERFGFTPEEVTAQKELAVRQGELALKGKQFEATFGAGLDANGQPIAPEAMKAAAQQDPTAMAIAHYQMAPPPSQTRGGIPSPIMRKVLAINPQYNATQYAANAETAKGYSPSGTQGQAITAADTALAHLATLSAAGEAMKNGNVQVLNQIANSLGAQVGQTPKATYETVLNMVGPDFSKSVIGAVGGEGERVATAQNFSSKLSDAQRESNIAAAVGLLGTRYEKLTHAYEQQMGVPLPRTLSPESQSIRQKYQAQAPGAAPKKISTKSEFDALPSGAAYIDPGDGKPYRKP
jgi:hypothetical protein